jgi:hypothetical protein
MVGLQPFLGRSLPAHTQKTQTATHSLTHGHGHARTVKEWCSFCVFGILPFKLGFSHNSII